MGRIRQDQQVSYEVQAAMVEAAGKQFWYWAGYRHLLRKAGVNENTVARLTDSGASKYEVMRQLLVLLDGVGPRGRQVQIQLIEGLVALPLQAQDGIDFETAKAAQDELRKVAGRAGLLPESRSEREQADERAAIRRRRREAEQREAARRDATIQRQELFREFCQLLSETGDKQGRGYRLEEMIGDVARLDGLRYTAPYRKGTVSQTDGMLTFEGFQYLIEARWRDEPADVVAVAALAQKAHRSLQSTRGLFLSMAGFRPEVVAELETGTKNLLLMSGSEFSLVLEGRVTLVDALRCKVDEGAKKGHIFFDITQAAHA